MGEPADVSMHNSQSLANESGTKAPGNDPVLQHKDHKGPSWRSEDMHDITTGRDRGTWQEETDGGST